MPSKQKKILHIRVSNFESEFKFDIPYKSTGKQLLDLICKTVALRETWYFGLQYVTLDNRGDIKLLWWLRPHKKIADQVASEPRGAGAGVSGAGGPSACGCGGEHAPSALLRFLFHPKLFPEDAVKELVQDVTRHLFYLEVKNSLWRRRQDLAASLLSSATCNEADVVTMACLAAHADNNGVPFWPATTPGSGSSVSVPTAGDAGPSESSGDLSELLTQMQAYLPTALVERWPSVLAVWESQVKPRYLNELALLSRDEAELEYLRLAQKQPFFGVSLHPIFDKTKRGNMLAVAASGLQVYNDHRLVQAHSWSEIKNVSYRDRKFTLKLNRLTGPAAASSSTAGSLGADPPPGSGSGQSSAASGPAGAGNGPAHQWIFWTLDQAESKAVMDLCVGSHELYVWRRRPETLEMQQIKAQAREERARKESERSRLSREREEKVAALEAKSALEGRCAELEMALRRSEETAELWAEKANVAEEEARLLQKKADQTAEALHRFHAVQADADARPLLSRGPEPRPDPPRPLGALPLAVTRLADSGEQLFLPMSPPLPRRAAVPPPVGSAVEDSAASAPPSSVHSAAEALNDLELATASSEQLLAALDRERTAFAAQNLRLQRQLVHLRSEVELIKREHRQCSLDRLPFVERVVGQTVVTKFPSAQQVWSSRAPGKAVEG